jgi:hypothetical protein
MKHTFDSLTETCLACGRTRLADDRNPTDCKGQLRYREWLRNGVWIREPITKPED